MGMSGVSSKLAAAVGAVMLVLYLALSPVAASALYVAFGGALVVAIVWSVASRRIVVGRGAWLTFAAANAMWVIGDAWSGLLELATEGPLGFPSPADVIYLAGYPILIAAIVSAARQRGPRRDTVAALDGLMVAAAAAVPIWVIWVAPALRAETLSGPELAVTLLYPAFDLVLLACGTRYVLGGGRWNLSNTLMVGGLGVTITADIAFNSAALSGAYAAPDPIDLLFLLSYLMWTVATLRPEAPQLLEPGHRAGGVSYRARTWALVAIVVLPLSVLAIAYIQGEPVDGRVVTVIFAVICASMVLRLRLIAQAGSAAWQGPALLSAAALVVVIVAAGLTSLQQRSARAEATADQLMEAVAHAERLDGLAVRADRPGADGSAARAQWAVQIARLRRTLDGSGVSEFDRTQLERLLMAYEAALGMQLRAVDIGAPRLGSQIERDALGPAHEAFIVRARADAAASAERATSAAYRARLISVLALALSLAFVMAVLVRFGGLGRRAELAHQALHDPLTGLPNRGLVEERLRQALAHPRRGMQGLVLLDLDDFKALNDSLGHEVGNELILALGSRLEEALPTSGGMLAHVGGDGFAIVLHDIASPACAVAVARDMLETLDAPFEIAGTSHVAHASVGVAVAAGAGDGSPTERAATTLRDAELAMYAAKEREGNSLELFTAEMHDAAAKRLELKAELARAIREEQFTLAYQPIVDIAAREVVGYEALVRWVHPDRGFVSPVEFIPLAEQTGLIVELGTWVLREACRQLAAWRDAALPERYVAVNVAGLQLQREDFAEAVAAALAASGLPPEALLLEVTESSLIHDIEGSQRRMNAVRELGVRFAIDDFGTGYSSLSYLSRFPLDVLKVDKSFIDEIATSRRGRAIVDAIVNMAASLDLAVVAEGIEQAEQLQALAEIGCGLGQGYFYARPMPAAEVPGFGLEPELRLVKTAKSA